MANIQDSCTDNSSCGDLSCYSSSFSSNDGDISGNASSDTSIRETHSQPSFGVAPYMFEPLASETDTTQSETDEDYIDLPVESRIGNIDWCKCSHCITMDTNSESMCCREIPHVLVEMESDRGEGCNCITEHPFFPEFVSTYWCFGQHTCHTNKITGKEWKNLQITRGTVMLLTDSSFVLAGAILDDISEYHYHLVLFIGSEPPFHQKLTLAFKLPHHKVRWSRRRIICYKV